MEGTHRLRAGLGLWAGLLTLSRKDQAPRGPDRRGSLLGPSTLGTPPPPWPEPGFDSISWGAARADPKGRKTCVAGVEGRGEGWVWQGQRYEEKGS